MGMIHNDGIRGGYHLFMQADCSEIYYTDGLRN